MNQTMEKNDCNAGIAESSEILKLNAVEDEEIGSPGDPEGR